jgi:hypothetical protein
MKFLIGGVQMKKEILLICLAPLLPGLSDSSMNYPAAWPIHLLKLPTALPIFAPSLP